MAQDETKPVRRRRRNNGAYPVPEEAVVADVNEKLDRIVGDLGRLTGTVEQISVNQKAQTESLSQIHEKVGTVLERSVTHAKRIDTLEQTHDTQKGFRSRLGGIWVGIMAIVALAAGVAAVMQAF